MARIESRAIGGYYKTPTNQLPLIAALLSVPAKIKTSPYDYKHVSFLDPCAADGEAIVTLQNLLLGEKAGSEIYTCEMEVSRYEALQKRLRGTSNWKNERCALGGDAFRVSFKVDPGKGVSFLYLNPPYDTEETTKRLEERFLVRFTKALAPQGVLAFVVPYKALEFSAKTLGLYYRDLCCFRFAGDDFAAYKQVVLFAVRSNTTLFEPNPSIVSQVQAWGNSPDQLPELPALGTGGSLYSLPTHSYDEAISEWEMRPVDFTNLLTKIRPWRETSRSRKGLTPTIGVLPDLPVQDLLTRVYDLAMPPRPAHIASGMAAGVFNGVRIDPDHPKSKFPPLLIKGVFKREWRTVSEKENANGEIVALEQVQAPELVVTVLDLITHKYHKLQTKVGSTSTTNVAEMGVGDLLKHYSVSLMHAMEKQCVILYDPRTDADKIQIAPSPRKPYTAQAHAIRANVTLLQKRPGYMPILLGEIGSGKSTVALLTALTMGAKRILIVCPPHLIKSWKNEIASCVPQAHIRVLYEISHVNKVQQFQPESPEAGVFDLFSNNPPKEDIVICILSRETAKLGHAWESVGNICPGCGHLTPWDLDLAKKRSVCEVKVLRPGDALAKETLRLARNLRPYDPYHIQMQNLLRTAFDRRIEQRYKGKNRPAYQGLDPAWLDQVLDLLLAKVESTYLPLPLRKAITWTLLTGEWDEKRILRVLDALKDPTDETNEADLDSFSKELLYLLPAGCVEQIQRTAAFKAKRGGIYDYGGYLSWLSSRDQLNKGEYISVGEIAIKRSPTGMLIAKEPSKAIQGSLVAALELLTTLTGMSVWNWSEPCGERLYQAIPQPKRTSLAKYIVQHQKHLFDFYVADEAQDAGTFGSAQEKALHRLATLKIPMIFQSGSIMNGYAESLFSNMWALSPGFRQEFSHDEQALFVTRYGYRKRLIEDKDLVSGEILEFGSQSDRVERKERTTGKAPGILPLFIFRHLLPQAVTIHKADLALELPACNQPPPFKVQPNKEQKEQYDTLLNKLLSQIRKDQKDEILAGKLFGQLGQFPSMLDRLTADVCGEQGYEIRYPKSVGGKLLIAATPLPASMILPKEEWMLRRVEMELSQGRNVMVLPWHVELHSRISRLIEENLGEKATIMWADKVPTGKRQDWIDREVVDKKRRVMISNPVGIQTGLNNLVHFATVIWQENPNCHPLIYRQAGGRVDRIGQMLETNILMPIYEGTTQEQLYELLMSKVAISTGTDGLDPMAALQAAGVESSAFITGLSIGKQLWQMLAGSSISRAA